MPPGPACTARTGPAAGGDAGERLLGHPAVVALFADHGRDLAGTRARELEFVATDRYTEARSGGQWRFAVTVSVGDENLELLVDETDGGCVGLAGATPPTVPRARRRNDAPTKDSEPIRCGIK